MSSRIIKLNHEWDVGDLLDGGGFGRVYSASSAVRADAVAKFVPKSPGAQREFLFVDLGDARNVVPVLDSGEWNGDYVLVMPRAEMEWTPSDGHLNACGAGPRKDGVHRAENPTRVPA